jgi:exopolysaccharide biosynthesis polyprenyl glycosylphosphotransferase
VPSARPIETPISKRSTASPARLIPGEQASIGSGPRKKPSSVTLDGRFWAGQDTLDFPARPTRDLLQIFPEAVLPTPSVRGQRWRLAACVAADFFFIVLDFVAVGYLCAVAEIPIRRDLGALFRSLPFPTSALGLLLLYGALFTLLGYSERLYHPEIIRSPRKQRLVLGKAMFWSTALMGVALDWSGLQVISIGALAASALLNFLTMLGWRNQWRRLAARHAHSGRDARHVLIIGAGTLGRRLAAYLGEDPLGKHAVRGFLDDYEPLGGDIRGRVEDLEHIARSEFVDEIILTIPQREVAQRVIREARRNRIDVKVVPDFFGFEPGPMIFETFGNVPVLTLRQEEIPAFGLFLKRAVDITSSMAGLLVAAPLLAAIALAIRLDSPGPALYHAPRAGLKGKRFHCYKFRTMVVDADKLKQQLRARNERQGPCFKIADDPRITRVGRFLRRYSLDELPQLWNVFKGEMSLVGPRPHPLDDFEQYDLEDLQRLEFTPGLTGLWQVTARRDPSFERNLALDLEYIERWTLRTDLWILYKTVSVVLQGTGA